MSDLAESHAAAGERADGIAQGSSIHRWEDRLPLVQAGAMSFHDSPEMKEQVRFLQSVEGPRGSCVTHLFEGSGMSLAHAWYKSGYPVMLHTHDGDCLYHITAGSVHFKGQEIGAGDSFFIPAGVPYSFVAGDKGAELAEFRTAEHFVTRFVPTKQSYWDRLVAAIKACQPRWHDEQPPSGRL